MNRNSLACLALGAGCLLSLLSPARAATFGGTVTLPDGRPAFGAMVSVFNAAKNQKQTVYTAADGSYAIVTPYSGSLDVRARLANFEDGLVTVEAAQDSVSRLDLQLKGFADAQRAHPTRCRPPRTTPCCPGSAPTTATSS
jgi:hypothetical protein